MFNKLIKRPHQEQKFRYHIEQFKELHDVVFIVGWAFFDSCSVKKISYAAEKGKWKNVEFEIIPSPDVAQAHPMSFAENARFLIRVFDKSLQENLLGMRLKFESGSQSKECLKLYKDGVNRGPYRKFVPDFFKDYVLNADIKTALEIGSRARSGVNNRDTYLPDSIEFTGLDVLDGEGVDVVCDAHQLSDHVENDKYQLVYSLNVFEHLLMPWKVVLEMNKIMKKGGIVMIFTHHAFPLHDLPCDYFRFSDNAWSSMFNTETGFEILKTELIDPVSIVPKCIYAGSKDIKDGDAYIHSAVIARKISNTTLSWPVDPKK